MEFFHSATWDVALGWHAIGFAKTSAILEFCFWFRFRPYHRSRHVILHQSAKFYQNRTAFSIKNDVMSIFKITDLRHLGFYGSNNGFFEKPMYANSQCSPCRSSIDTIALNCLVFEKIAFFAFWRQTDRQSDKQTDSTDPLSRSRYRERRFNKQICRVYGCCEWAPAARDVNKRGQMLPAEAED